MPTLEVTVVEARNLKDKETIGKSDPYCIVKCEGKKEKTKHIKNDLNPHWDETFRFEAKDLKGQLELELWDHNLLRDEDMGELLVPISTLRRGMPTDQWYPVTNGKGKGRGEIRLRLHAVDFDGPNAGPAMPAQAGVSQQPGFPQQQFYQGQQQHGGQPPQQFHGKMPHQQFGNMQGPRI